MEMKSYDVIASMADSTVVAEYTSEYGRADSYQSEHDLEEAFIKQLTTQGYERLFIKTEKDLINNLRVQLERLNNFQFTDFEWTRFFSENLASSNEGIVEKTRKIQKDHVRILFMDDGVNFRNITLIDKRNVHNNHVQVINQYEESGGTHDTRYDVTILVNGFPMVHIELKRRGVAIREAFNQIKRYEKNSFWASSGLYDYVQIFVISNGTHTKYYSNTTRLSHIEEDKRNSTKKKKTSNSFEFTSYWADGTNKVILDLMDFTKTFFSKGVLLNILTKYCVFNVDNLLLVMRPYQIVATERILSKIEISNNYKRTGTIDAGGYIWHTTGSGKTLTSFKTAQLATGLPYIYKVLFVVDRKDLDFQTIREYNKFEKDSVNSNQSTYVLQKQLEDPNVRIIVTTIQKLSTFVKKNKKHEVYDKNVVIIFDECHRSQFGEMNEAITKAFKKYNLFGFTGTPIFADNAGAGNKFLKLTTPQVFGERLHTYTIVDAIRDGNVLPFRIDYIKTMKEEEEIKHEQVRAIDREKALSSTERVSNVVEYILDHFDQKTKRSHFYQIKDIKLDGFNSIFAVNSIPMAKKYYEMFKNKMDEKGKRLKIATVFSYAPNEDAPEDGLLEEDFEPSNLDLGSREFLESAISDYNEMFSTNYSTSSDSFENYYKNISERMKNREIDLLIVVNMFLTGFDATTLNTLWVDKNLKMHGLIQAFSRTNRILNSVKTYGNIVCFRGLEQATDDAIALFGDKDAGSIVLLKSFEDYYYGYTHNGKKYEGYEQLIDRLREKFPVGQLITSEDEMKEFINLFNAILRVKNILTSFDQFNSMEIISVRDYQDYQSLYLDIKDAIRPPDIMDREYINNDIVFEMELIKQVEVNIDYILMLVEKYKDKNKEDREIMSSIVKAIDSTPDLRSKKELILDFIDQVNAASVVDEEWKSYVRKAQEDELAELITDENLKEEETLRLIDNSFRDGILKTTGTDFDSIMPPMSLFDKNRSIKKLMITEKLLAFFEKYFGIS